MTGENETLAMAEEPINKRVTFSPDPEAQRGRKRRRTPVPYAIVTTTKTLSGDSATFRGRSRHRATSVLAMSTLSSTFSSRNPSLNRSDRSASPSRKKLFRFPPLAEQQHRRRCQSPSRSRSATVRGGDVSASESMRRRRRQRTRSRSRDHGITSHPTAGVEVTSLVSPLRVVELAVDSEGSRDGDK
ncbi:hypothetical protein CONLIGDRAFT_259505 [Coniochaeta ligniaria NRRL 30616]|uniref:Uncharacterized protein n=1 Tax=Coniochaeta ligniaria NRRL 30616 TaxID=1408157 RepID=A0A1J7IYD2_9PEZI|nr:hypothetical protein CONLIGDRAFT_259505 [Coniochaeta ligniaria NRRL 30616]